MDFHYKDSWEIYKAHTSQFDDDFTYYLKFCTGYSTLDMFAGYGRITNHLVKNDVCVESVELEPELAKFITLPQYKNHICDILEFQSLHQFDRIIAPYNSFCLFTEDKNITRFFSQLNHLLTPGGLVSLSYYHQAYWQDAIVYAFEFKGHKIYYQPQFDLSKLTNGNGTWIDVYELETNHTLRCEYPLRIYRNDDDLLQYTQNTNLVLVDKVINFNETKVSEPGWIDYVFQKQA